jgi:hypothetical protein
MKDSNWEYMNDSEKLTFKQMALSFLMYKNLKRLYFERYRW